MLELRNSKWQRIPAAYAKSFARNLPTASLTIFATKMKM